MRERLFQTAVFFVLASSPVLAEAPRFTVRPQGDEDAFAGSVYKAVVVAEGCAKSGPLVEPPRVIVEAPQDAVYRDDVLSFLPAGRSGEAFEVRLRAVNADGEATASWRVTLVDPLDLEFDAAAEYSGNFEEHFERVPAALLPGLASAVRGGDLRITVPATGRAASDNLDSWCGFDRSPRWSSALRVFGAFEIETTLYFVVPPGDAGNGFHIGLALDRGDEDLTIAGPLGKNGANGIEYERTCYQDSDHSPAVTFPRAGLEEVMLRVTVDGKEQTYQAKRPGDATWQVVGYASGARPPLEGVGLAVKTWGAQTSFTAGFSSFHYRGLPPGAPIIHGPDDEDWAFTGGEYTAAVDVETDGGATLEVLSPPGASIDGDGILRRQVTEGAGAVFTVRVHAVNPGGEALDEWQVHVVSPVRHEFDSAAELASFQLEGGSSSRLGEVSAAVTGGQLRVALPPSDREDFDSWCGYDRTPRWLQVLGVTGTYAVETLMSFTTPPSDLAEGYHVGLAVDRGFADIAIDGASRGGIEYERTCSADCENTLANFPGLWSDPAAKVHLRIESTGAEQHILARRPQDAAWTEVARVAGRRPLARGIGLAAKAWGAQGPLTAAFDFFDYGLPGCAITGAPVDQAVTRGALYAPLERVRARGVNPRFDLVAAPPGATIDEWTGEVRWQVPAAAPTGPVDFTARAMCGTAVATASWTVTVRAAEPGVAISAFAPPEISVLGKTPFELRGAGFTAATDVIIGGIRIDPQFVDDATLRGTAPPHAAGAVEVAVEDAVRGAATLPRAATYIGPLAVAGIEPASVLQGEALDVTVTGVAFTPETVVRVGAASLENSTFVDARMIRGRVPPSLAPGTYDVVATDGAASAARPQAFVVLPAIQITSFSPPEVSVLGKTPFEVRGSGFTEATDVTIGGVLVDPQFVDDTTLRGMAPPHAAGAVAVMVEDAARGSTTLARATMYIGPLALSGISPASANEGEAADVTVTGVAFTPGTTFRVGSESLQNLVFVDARTVRGRVPGTLACGEHDLSAADGAASATRPRAFTVTASPEVTSVTPFYLSRRGTTPVELRGRNFTPDMRITFESGGVSSELAFELVSATVVRGVAPAHPVSGPVDIVARCGSGPASRRAGAASYDTPTLFAPDEIEATLVDGIAEFQWVNGARYDVIHVYRGGELLDSLPGNATFFRDPSIIDSDRAEYRVVGELADGTFTVVPFFAVIPNCPEPVFPVADRGPKDFTLRGGHPGYSTGTGEGAGGAFLDGTMQINAAGFPLVLTSSGSAQYNTTDPGQFFLGFNELLSGFNLFEPSTKLRIEVHGAKIRNAADLELRVLIEGVDVDRQVELVLPDPPLDPVHDWIDFTYNTLNPPPPPGAEPPPPGAVPQPDPPLPAGQYRVHIYAVGGDYGIPHYSISSDFSSDQILVPGVGCPPYPLIRVTDTTEKNSNPVIEGIEQLGDVKPFLFPAGKDDEGNLIPLLKAKLMATTSDPDIPADPILSYKWEIDNTLEVKTKITAAPVTTMVFPGYGFYMVTLTVQDQRCGFAKKKLPVKIHPPCVPPPAGAGPNITFPFPRPKNLHFISDLPGGMDSFPTPIPATFGVFVVDAACSGPLAKTQSVQVGLFLPGDGAPVLEVDACLIDTLGNPVCGEDVTSVDDAALVDGRFWEAKFPDMRLLPELPLSSSYLELRARGSTIPGNDNDSAGWGPWRDVTEYSGATELKGINQLRVHHKPAFLDVEPAYTSGSYDADFQRYSFRVEMTVPGAGGVSFPDTPPVDLPIVKAPFPALTNQVASAGQGVALSFQKGEWELESHQVDLDAVILNGPIGGSVELLGGGSGAGGGVSGDGAGGAASFDPESLSYEYCDRKTLFEESFKRPLFNSIIWTGTIGPIYITVRATASLSVALSLQNQVELHMSGFPAPGEEALGADFWVLPDAQVALDAAIRSDIFFGILSLRGGATIGVDFRMPFHIGVTPSALVGPEAGLTVKLGIDLWFKGCVSLVLKDLCHTETWNVLEPTDLITPTSIGEPTDCTAGGAGGGAGFDGAGGAGPVVLVLDAQLNSPDRQFAMASSPSGERQVVVGRFPDIASPIESQLRSVHRSKGGDWQGPPNPFLGSIEQGLQSDPAVVFLDETHVLCVWTQDFSEADPALPQDPNALVDIAAFNAVTRHHDLAYRVGTFKTGIIDGKETEYLDWGNLSDPTAPPDLLTADGPGDLRADGTVSLARVPGESTVWATWVRFETADMVVPVDPPEPDPCAEFNADPGGDGPPPLITARVDMRATSIVARRFVGGVPSGPLYQVSGPNGATDIEPHVATSPEGDAYCVWVNDSDSTHYNLTDSNVGRNVFFSRFAGGAWTTPQPVIADVSSMPGILEPSLALVGGGHGLLAFTALPANADPCDTGLGNLRLLYVVRLSNAGSSPVWDAPVLIAKDCDTPLYVHWPLVLPNEKTTPVDPFKEDLISPVIIVANEVGPADTGLSLGNIMSLTADPATGLIGTPTTLTSDGALHQDVAATMTAGGELVTVSQSFALPAVQAAGGAGGGAATDDVQFLTDDVRLSTIPLVADPAISYCRISDPCAGPGAAVRATVGVANNGFAATPADDAGGSLLHLRIVYEDEGERRVVAEETLPRLAPGSETMREIPLIIPRHPVMFVAEVDEVAGERNAADNVRACALGAQPPRRVSCELLELEGTSAVRVRWANAGLYDTVLVYRDRSLLAEVPGSASSYLDAGVMLHSEDGGAITREYGVRGVIQNSRSVPATCSVEVPGIESPEPRFRRGDANSDGTVNISDPLFILGYLFVDGPRPLCTDAADVNDDGRMDISDGTFALLYLFDARGRPIPAPGPEVCGVDPTDDGNTECRYPEAVCR